MVSLAKYVSPVKSYSTLPGQVLGNKFNRSASLYKNSTLFSSRDPLAGYLALVRQEMLQGLGLEKKAIGFLTSQRMAIKLVGGVALALLMVKIVVRGQLRLVCFWATSKQKAVETGTAVDLMFLHWSRGKMPTSVDIVEVARKME